MKSNEVRNRNYLIKEIGELDQITIYECERNRDVVEKERRLDKYRIYNCSQTNLKGTYGKKKQT